jgi:hypothetical protein
VLNGDDDMTNRGPLWIAVQIGADVGGYVARRTDTGNYRAGYGTWPDPVEKAAALNDRDAATSTPMTDPQGDLARAITRLDDGAELADSGSPPNRRAAELTVAQCQAVLADRLRGELDRAGHDLAAQGWQPLPADWHARAEAGHALATALGEVAAERDRLVGQVRRVEAWAADRLGTAIGRPYAIEVLAALNGSDGWVESLAGRVDGEVPS